MHVRWLAQGQYKHASTSIEPGDASIPMQRSTAGPRMLQDEPDDMNTLYICTNLTCIQCIDKPGPV